MTEHANAYMTNYYAWLQTPAGDAAYQNERSAHWYATGGVINPAPTPPTGGIVTEPSTVSLDAAIRARLDDPIDIALNGRPYLDAIRYVLDECVKAERAGVVGWPQILRQMIADKLGVSDEPPAVAEPAG